MILEDSNCIGAVSLNLLVRQHEPTIDSYVADDTYSLLPKRATLAGEERRLLAQALERYVWQSIEGCEISGNNSRHDEI